MLVSWRPPFPLGIIIYQLIEMVDGGMERSLHGHLRIPINHNTGERQFAQFTFGPKWRVDVPGASSSGISFIVVLCFLLTGSGLSEPRSVVGFALGSTALEFDFPFRFRFFPFVLVAVCPVEREAECEPDFA